MSVYTPMKGFSFFLNFVIVLIILDFLFSNLACLKGFLFMSYSKGVLLEPTITLREDFVCFCSPEKEKVPSNNYFFRQKL